MRIEIPPRSNIPGTNLYGKIILAEGQSLKDREVMLLVPGGPGGNHTVYNAVIEQFLKQANLVLFDPRGCGNSDPSDAQYCTLEHFIDDIESIRQFFGLEKIILVGGSYGAVASLGYAIKYPAALTQLILIAGVPSSRFIETAKINLDKLGTLEQKQMAEKLWNGNFKSAEDFAEFYKVMAPLYIHNYRPAEKPPTTKPNIPYNIEVTNLGYKKFLREFDFESSLEKIQCKTLILSGDKDWINDPSHAQLMAQKIPNSTLYIFEDCGHFIWVDKPDEFFAAINQFISSQVKNNVVCKV